MDNLRLKQKSRLLKKICQNIIQKTSSSSKFTIPNDYDTDRLFEKFILQIYDTYGSVITDRLVDIAVFVEYYYREERISFVGYLTQMQHRYSEQMVDRYRLRNGGMAYYEDEWLQKYGLTRQYLKSLEGTPRISEIRALDTTFEDSSRKRFYNTVMGFVYCHSHTSGWDPNSKPCQTCKFAERCKADLRNSHPSLLIQREQNYELY